MSKHLERGLIMDLLFLGLSAGLFLLAIGLALASHKLENRV
jgi:hypothetical protein